MKFVKALAILALFSAACGDSETVGEGNTTRSVAPRLGSADSMDSADYSCQIILRQATRRMDGGRYIERCAADGRCYWTWRATADVPSHVVENGSTAHVLYRASNGDWLSVDGVAIGGAEEGFQRFGFDIYEGTLSPGSTSTTGISRYTLPLIPYLQTADGQRIFDHNRVVEPSESYVLNATNALSILDDPRLCSSDPVDAVIQFSADWKQTVFGELKGGNSVAVVYDQNRSAQCRGTHNGNPAWTLEANARFTPTGDVQTASVIAFNQRFGSEADSVSPKMVIPDDASKMDIWFKNAAYTGGFCESFDSNFGRNFSFDVAALKQPEWVGNTTFTISRSASSQCDSGTTVDGGFSFDTWGRSRAAVTSICTEIYTAGVSEKQETADAFRTELQVRYDGTTEWKSIPMTFEKSVANNARYYASIRSADPFPMYGSPCATVPVQRDEQSMWTGADLRIAVNGQPQAHTFRGSFTQYLAPECF